MMQSQTIAPRISVAMATFNGAKHIREQLDSIARQTVLPLELVVTDDGSTDGTTEILDDFARLAPFPVRVFRNETRLGYADNFLKASSLCGGDLIAFCDQDDIWMEDKIRICLYFFTDPEVMLAIHSARTINSLGERGFRFPDFPGTRVFEAGACNPLSVHQGFAMVVKRSVLEIVENNNRPPALHSHDLWSWFLAGSIGKIATISDELVLYRQHDRNVFGAQQRATLASQARDIVETLNYDQQADSERICSDLLMKAAERRPDRAHQLKTSAQRLHYRSRLHRFRTQIYSRSSSLFVRLLNFGRIFMRGGYLPDSRGIRLGPRALLKDVLLGISGIYKISEMSHSSQTTR